MPRALQLTPEQMAELFQEAVSRGRPLSSGPTNPLTKQLQRWVKERFGVTMSEMTVRRYLDRAAELRRSAEKDAV